MLEECRTVLPGMQALFGFQLIAVFNSGFREQLTPGERILHLAAIILVTVAIILVMTPAVLHRQREPLTVSRRFLTIASRLLMSSMAPLAAGLCLDVYLVARVIVDSRLVAAIVATALLGVFILMWGVLPRVTHIPRDRGD